MLDRRFLGSLSCLLLLAPAGWAQPLAVSETLQPGDCFQVQLEMKLSGQLKIMRGGSPASLKLEATGTLGMTEKVLASSPDQLADKVARLYDTARATITVEKDKSERTLRPERRLIVAQRHKDTPLVYAPAGTLTREEADLTAQHLDTLFLTGLLPGKPVEVGETWKVPSHVVQALCNFEGVTEQDVVGKLEEAKDQTATLTFTGSATGIDGGAMVKSKVESTVRFDRTSKRLVRLEWKQTDERDQGPVSPASSMQTAWTLTRKAVSVPESLSEVALVGVPDNFTPPTTMTDLSYRDPEGRFALTYPREWQLVSSTPTHLVLRHMDRGDFLAQVSIAPWTRTAPGKPMTPDEFKEALARTPGWEPEQELQAGEVSGQDRPVYRLAVAGKMDGVPVVQNFYLIAAPKGEQVVVTFTMSPKQVEKFGARDLSLIGALEVPAKK
jgi:hypothetical protein